MNQPAPPSGYTLRSATQADLTEVVAFLRLCDVHDWGEPDTMEAQIAFEWGLPDMDLPRDAWIVHGDDGVIAAYTWILGRDEHRRLDGWGAVHPEHRGRGLGTYLLRLRQHLEEVHAGLAPDGAPVTSYFGTIAPDLGARELAERFGYREVRHFWQMVIDLPPDGSLPEPAWPAGVSVRTFERGRDDRAIHAVMEESFAEHWGHVEVPFEDWRPRLETEWFDPSLVLLAEVGDEMAGALIGGVLEGEGWVMTLGVRAPWRGRGIGEALLRTSLREFDRRGLRVAKLDVDAGNETGATRLYERVGMRVNRQYDEFDRVVRPGSD
jgi:mycothiol synthase